MPASTPQRSDLSCSVEDFYNPFSAHYDEMFSNLDELIETQAQIVGPLIENICGRSEGLRTLDPTCGLGTQALGLARRGHIVTGTDISAGMVARARHEAASRGLHVNFAVADMRNLNSLSDSEFDAAVCLGNSVCLLTDEEELVQAFTQVRMKLRPGAPFIVGSRNYELALSERRRLDGPTHYQKDGERWKVHQVWEWLDERRYVCSVYIDHERSKVWQCVSHSGCLCRAWPRGDLASALEASGFEGLRWVAGNEDCVDTVPVTTGGASTGSVYHSGFDQVIVVGLAPK